MYRICERSKMCRGHILNADQMRWAHLALEEFGAPLAGEASHIEDVGYVRVR